MLLDMKLSKFSLSPMSQSVTSSKSSPFGPAVSEQSLWSLKEMAGSEPRLMVVSGNCWHPKKERSEFEILKSFKMLRNAIRDLTPLKNFGV